jgi:hypothetical protein
MLVDVYHREETWRGSPTNRYDRPQQLLHLGAGFGRHDGEALDGVRKNGGFVGSSARSKAMAGRR